jgi:hypothetical protein
MTLDVQLSWSSYIDKVVVNIGRGVSVIKVCSVFLTQKSTVLVGQALSLLNYCAAKKSVVKKEFSKAAAGSEQSSTACP